MADLSEQPNVGSPGATSGGRLADLFLAHRGNVSDKWEQYLAIYEAELASFAARGKPVRLLEIGVQNGGSLEIWRSYLPQGSSIIGLDIDPACGQLALGDGIRVLIGDAGDPASLDRLLGDAVFDIIVDDGSHRSEHIIAAFESCWARVAPGGLFIAEDLHCSYFDSHGGGFRKADAAIEHFKALADAVNADHFEGDAAQNADPAELDRLRALGRQIARVTFYDSVAVVQRAAETREAPYRRIITGMDRPLMDLAEAFGTHMAAQQLRNLMLSPAAAQAFEAPPQGMLAAQRQMTDELRAAREAQGVELQELRAAREVQGVELQELRAARETQGIELQDLRATREMQGVELQGLRSALATPQASTSWRLTAPLRTLMHVIRSTPTLPPAVPGQPASDVIAATGYEKPGLLSENKDTASFKVLSGHAANSPLPELHTDRSRVVAFYLPQYHRIPENSEWWGPGFTEWTNVVKGRPNYDGHYQPHLPRELGFYDLSNVNIMQEQATLANLFGVTAFCFYYYWFSGRTILSAPIENFLQSDIEMGYCLCWANENWTRTWDGDTRSVLMHQQYLDGDPAAFIASLIPHFKDRRYLRVDGKPILLVYRAKEIPDPKAVFGIWRDAVVAAGFPGLHIAAVDFYDISRPDEVGADALVEFPPHKFNGPQSAPDRMPSFINPHFAGSVVDYAKVMAQSANRPQPDFTLYRGAVPSWDNTARRQNTPTIIHGSEPDLFSEWLSYLRAYNRHAFSNRLNSFIFVNAWNEWGEGCHLEPDQRWGLGYLEALKKSSFYDPNNDNVQSARNRLLAAAADSIHRRTSDHIGRRNYTRDSLIGFEVTQPSGSAVRRISAMLRKYPKVHSLGRRLYRYYRFGGPR